MPACPTKAQLNSIVDSLIETRAQEQAAFEKTGKHRPPEKLRYLFQCAIREAYELGHGESKRGIERSDYPIDPPPPSEPAPAPGRPQIQGAPT